MPLVKLKETCPLLLLDVQAGRGDGQHLDQDLQQIFVLHEPLFHGGRDAFLLPVHQSEKMDHIAHHRRVLHLVGEFLAGADAGFAAAEKSARRMARRATPWMRLIRPVSRP
jgi:hypothetical protein